MTDTTPSLRERVRAHIKQMTLEMAAVEERTRKRDMEFKQQLEEKLNRQAEELSRKTKEVNRKAEELNRKTKEVNRKAEELNTKAEESQCNESKCIEYNIKIEEAKRERGEAKSELQLHESQNKLDVKSENINTVQRMERQNNEMELERATDVVNRGSEARSVAKRRLQQEMEQLGRREVTQETHETLQSDHQTPTPQIVKFRLKDSVAEYVRTIKGGVRNTFLKLSSSRGRLKMF